MSGDDRTTYLFLVCEGEVRDDSDDWETIVGVETGIAYSMDVTEGFDIPRLEIAALIDAGELP
jgi:hypothetical protein